MYACKIIRYRSTDHMHDCVPHVDYNGTCMQIFSFRTFAVKSQGAKSIYAETLVSWVHCEAAAGFGIDEPIDGNTFRPAPICKSPIPLLQTWSKLA